MSSEEKQPHIDRRSVALGKNALIIALGTVLPKLVTLITLPILTGCLSKSDFGVYDLVITLVAFFLPAASLQIQTAAFRFLVDCRKDENDERTKEIVSSTFAFALVASLVALVIFAVLFRGDVLLKVGICLYFLFDLLANVAKQCARGFGRNKLYSASAALGCFVQLGLTVLFLLVLDLGLLGSVYLLALTELAACAFLFCALSLARYVSPKSVSCATLKELISYSWPMVPNSLAMWAMRFSNRLVITFFLGVAANAAFAVAYKIPQMLNLAQSAFTLAWQENASLAVDDKDSKAYYSRTFSGVIGLTTACASVLIACVPLLFMILVRGSYDEAYQQIAILVLALFFYCLAAYLGGIYVARKDTKSVGLTTVVALVLNLAIDVVLVPVIGLWAASLAMLASFILLVLLRVVQLVRRGWIDVTPWQMVAASAFLCVQVALSLPQLLCCDIVNGAIALVAFVLLARFFLKQVKK